MPSTRTIPYARCRGGGRHCWMRVFLKGATSTVTRGIVRFGLSDVDWSCDVFAVMAEGLAEGIEGFS